MHHSRHVVGSQRVVGCGVLLRAIRRNSCIVIGRKPAPRVQTAADEKQGVSIDSRGINHGRKGARRALRRPLKARLGLLRGRARLYPRGTLRKKGEKKGKGKQPAVEKRSRRAAGR